MVDEEKGLAASGAARRGRNRGPSRPPWSTTPGQCRYKAVSSMAGAIIAPHWSERGEMVKKKTNQQA